MLYFVVFKKLSAFKLKVADWCEINKLTHMNELATVYFERNPIQQHCPADYRRKLILALPTLSQIDATLCR
jgi:protein phosphatase 1 regulatory subunit 7